MSVFCLCPLLIFQPAHTWIRVSVFFGASLKPFVMGVGNGLACVAVDIVTRAVPNASEATEALEEPQ